MSGKSLVEAEYQHHDSNAAKEEKFCWVCPLKQGQKGKSDQTKEDTIEVVAVVQTSGNLPFCILHITDGENNKIKTIGMLDSGAGCNLMEKDFVKANNLKFVEHPLKSKISSFTGTKIVAVWRPSYLSYATTIDYL